MRVGGSRSNEVRRIDTEACKNRNPELEGWVEVRDGAHSYARLGDTVNGETWRAGIEKVMMERRSSAASNIGILS